MFFGALYVERSHIRYAAAAALTAFVVIINRDIIRVPFHHKQKCGGQRGSCTQGPEPRGACARLTY